MYKPWLKVHLLTFLCQDMNKLQEETNEVNKQASLLEKENQRARKQIAELSQQVQLADCMCDFITALILLLHQLPPLESLHRKLLSFSQTYGNLGQVRVLLVELEEARGAKVVREEVNSAVSSSSEVQGLRQVAFRSVEELQQQNQNLLIQMRELEDQHEKSATEAKIAMYYSQLPRLNVTTHLKIVQHV